MNQTHIIQLERGTLYIKLRETFDTSCMQIHCTLAEISRKRIHIVKANSKGEVSSTSMTLNAEEFALLTEGMEMVNEWWETSPLKYREVLLDCAHTVEWDEHQASLYRDNRSTLPLKGEETYCWECERTSHIYRLSINDFCETPEDDQQGEDEAIRNAGLDGELRRMR